MESIHPGWWRRHGWTLGLLLAAFSLSFLIRTIWTYPLIAQWGPLYTYAGGSDSYYHSRVMTYIIQTNHNLIYDPMLRFPVGSINPREPLFDWMNAVLGIVFAPFFGGNAQVAGAWFLDLQAPLWSALGVFPVYLIGREVSGRRMGLIAALIFPFLSANIDSSTFGYANYLSFYTFVILVVVYSYIRMVKSVGTRRWVTNYRDVRSYWPALKAFFATERTGVKWAVFTGVGLGALALSWQGYTYAIVVVGISLLVLMLVERIRRVDSFGLYVSTWIVGLIGFPMAMPYYLVQHAFRTFFDLPLLLFFGVLGLLLPFLLLRDVPWVFSIPFLVGVVGAAAVFLRVFLPFYFTDIVTGQGYFVKNLIYSTVAEAQAPSIDALVLGYGIFTFFLAFVGLAVFAYLLAKQRFKRHHVVFMVFAIVSVYLPISASKFFLLGSPAFALLAAESFHRALELGSYPELRRTVASLSDRRSQFAAFRKAFKARHVLVLALVTALVLPNVWISVDAGIPSNTKEQFAIQVNDSIPSWLKLNNAAPASSIFGAAGTSLDTPNQYDSAAYNWLAQQDTNVPAPSRPAFISWWDYGFQAIDQGQHPSVADNFQNGIDPAGQFLLSQNESLAIGVLITTLLQAEQRSTGLQYLPATLNQQLSEGGLNVTALHNYLVNESYDYQLVVSQPSKYLPVNPSTITDDNAMYLAMSYFIADSLSLSAIAKVYNDVQAYTGWSIRYAMSDSRLFPFSGTDTGIFYAPADLTGRVVDSAGIPTSFFNVTAISSTGEEYPLGQVPGGVSIVNYEINYSAPFYNSMIYHTYIGYNGTDIGLSGGIPGLEGAAASYPLEPGWMLQHFEEVYKTAYYCPGVKNATNGSACFLPANLPDASRLANQTKGTLDASAISYFQGGETMLAYYAGQPFLGTVTLADGTPVPGLRVTVYDQNHIPHMTTITSPNGTFSVVLPPGNDTVNITTGTFESLSQADSVVVKSVPVDVPNAIGYSFDAPNLVERIPIASSTIQGFVYWNQTSNGTYTPDQDTLVQGAQVVFSGVNGTPVFSATTDASGAFKFTNVPPNVYNYTVTVAGHVYAQTNQTVGPNATVNATVGLTPSTISGTVYGPTGSAAGGATVSLALDGSVIETNTTTAEGAYSFPTLGPANYTVSATSSGGLLRSVVVSVPITTSGGSETQNLTLRSVSAVAVELLANGAPAAGIPVTFTPILSFGASTSAVASVGEAAANATLVTTNAQGYASAYVPYGNYSVYALGYSASALVAGLGTVDSDAAGYLSTATLALTPAVSLRGTVTGGEGAGTTGITTHVVAFAAPDVQLITTANSTGNFLVFVPAGSYSLLGLQGSTSATAAAYEGLVAAHADGSTTVTIALSSAIEAKFAVGAILSSGAFYSAASTVATVSIGDGGPAISMTSGTNGSVVFYLPSEIPSASTGFCINGSAPGYVTAQVCAFPPSTITKITEFPVALATVPTRLTVVGLPPATPVTVNLTAVSPTATPVKATGGPSFSFALTPGIYGVGAEAVIGNGTRIYLPPSVFQTAIPFGANSSNLTLFVVPEVNATGTLALPTGLAVANVTVALSSPIFNVTVNGTNYSSTGFRIAPGNYTASITGHGPGGSYANLTRVTVSVKGVITPKLNLSEAGVSLSGTLLRGSGTTLSVNATVTLLGPGGTEVSVAAKSGSFSTTLVPNATYAAYANATVFTSGANGSYYETFSSAPGTNCTVGASASTCAITMLGTVDEAAFNATLDIAGGPALAPATLRLVGPYPSLNVTTLSTSNGTISTALLPGEYSVYAATVGGSPYATFGRVLVVPGETGAVVITLQPSWLVSATVAAASTPGLSIGAANVTVTNGFGISTLFLGVAPGSSIQLPLPAGSYTINGTAPGHLNGFPGVATGSLPVSVVKGNLGVTLALAVPSKPSVVGTLVGPGSVTVRAGGSATFSFSVHANGNVPVTVTPVGSPAYWTFSFSPSNFTLSPSGGAASGEVTLTVPLGTPVEHPGVELSFQLANGTSIGTVSPAPVVNVVGYYGVQVGSSGSLKPELGPTEARLPFYVRNSGNRVESIRLSVVDASRLARLGWTYAFTLNGTPISPLLTNVSAGANQTYYLNLTTNATNFSAPGFATVQGAVANVTGTYTSSAALAVPLGRVAVSTANGSAVRVTGPAIGPAPNVLPEWLLIPIVFAPAIALAVGVLTYRWWRTRRWTRR